MHHQPASSSLRFASSSTLAAPVSILLMQRARHKPDSFLLLVSKLNTESRLAKSDTSPALIELDHLACVFKILTTRLRSSGGQLDESVARVYQWLVTISVKVGQNLPRLTSAGSAAANTASAATSTAGLNIILNVIPIFRFDCLIEKYKGEEKEERREWLIKFFNAMQIW